MDVLKSYRKFASERPAVGCIAWLGLLCWIGAFPPCVYIRTVQLALRKKELNAFDDRVPCCPGGKRNRCDDSNACCHATTHQTPDRRQARADARRRQPGDRPRGRYRRGDAAEAECGGATSADNLGDMLLLCARQLFVFFDSDAEHDA